MENVENVESAPTENVENVESAPTENVENVESAGNMESTPSIISEQDDDECTR